MSSEPTSTASGRPGAPRAWALTAGPALMLALAVPALAADAGLRDPLRPPGWGRSTPERDTFDAGAWRLESTLTARGRHVAIINGRPVRPGETVGGARVIAVEPGRVRLDYRGREFTIRRPIADVRAGSSETRDDGD